MGLESRNRNGRFTDELVFAQLPPKELTLELRPVDHTDDNLVIHRGLLRTAISDTIQYEQFLGTIEGSGNFKVGLTAAGAGVRIQAAVDGSPVEVLRDSEDRCVIRLGDKGVHRVELQLWVSTPNGDLNTQVTGDAVTDRDRMVVLAIDLATGPAPGVGHAHDGSRDAMGT